MSNITAGGVCPAGGTLGSAVLSLPSSPPDLLFIHLSPLSCFLSKHSSPLFLLPPGELDSWMFGACLAKLVATSVSEPNIYICVAFIFIHPFFFSPSSAFPVSCAADCRLNISHAGVLLVERRGSYPLIDLRILKSKCPDAFKG